MPGPVGTFISGKNSIAQCNGETLTANSFSVEESGENLDTTNFESNGFKQYVFGLQGLTWSLDGDWDADKTPYGPLGLYPRDNGQNLNIQAGLGSGTFAMPFFACSSSSMKSTTSGKVNFDSKGTSQGSYTTP